MSAEVVWFVGAPVVAAALGFGAVRLRCSQAMPVAVEDDNSPFTLAPAVNGASAPSTEAHAATDPLRERDASEAHAAVDPPELDASEEAVVGSAIGERTAVLQPRSLVARLRRGVERIVRLRHAKETADALVAPRPDVLHDDRAEIDRDESAIVAEMPSPAPKVGDANVGSAGAAPRDNVTPLFPAASGNGIVEFESEASEAPDGERPIAGAEWAGAVSAREVSLAASLEARDAARRQDELRQAEADAARRQEDLERIAVAEEVRVRAEARARRWFVRLDGDLDAPTVAQRMALAGTLGIRAPWAGKLLREAFAQEEEARVRARIIGALVAGDHLEVAEPFERAFAQGGIERGAVWEALKPRCEDAPWITALLAPLHEAMTAA